MLIVRRQSPERHWLLTHWLFDSVSSPLLQVFLDPFCFSQQEGNVFIRRVDELGDNLHVVLEVFCKFLVLLIAPRGAQRLQLAAERRHPLFQVLVEFFEIVGEAAQFGWVDDGLGHGSRLGGPRFGGKLLANAERLSFIIVVGQMM
jgi:hypothetical protein